MFKTTVIATTVAAANAATVYTGAAITEVYLSEADCNAGTELAMYTSIGIQFDACSTSTAGDGTVTSMKWVDCSDDGTSLTLNANVYASADCSGTAVASSPMVQSKACTSSYQKSFCTNSKDYWNSYQTYYYSHEEIYNVPDGKYTCTGDVINWSVGIADLITCVEEPCAQVAGETHQAAQRVCNSNDDDDVCFHIDTKIDYKGVEYTYEELKAGKEPECSVPHSPSSKGVVITTSCDKTVRVTDTHLMATTKGFQLAYSLKAGDVMYGDYGKETCVVKSVEKEKTTQQYFGLNCVHSEVLASGLRASTFGDFHTLPSWYMTYVGGLVGSNAASNLGEYIAEWYFQK